MHRYLPNRYTAIYFAIIDRAKKRILPLSIYRERHHILPKSLGGNDNPENIVDLTAKEHYLCHRLLTKMTEGDDLRKMRYAAYMLSVAGKHHNRRIPCSRVYAILREELSQASRGRPGPNAGKQMSSEQRAKISATLRGRVVGTRTEETRKKLRAKTMSPEARAKLSAARTGKTYGPRSPEAKANMSAWQKGKPKEKRTCEFCGIEASLLNISRWHGEKCKLSPKRC